MMNYEQEFVCFHDGMKIYLKLTFDSYQDGYGRYVVEPHIELVKVEK